MSKDSSKGVGFFGATFAGVTRKDKDKDYREEYADDVSINDREAKKDARKSGSKKD